MSSTIVVISFTGLAATLSPSTVYAAVVSCSTGFELGTSSPLFGGAFTPNDFVVYGGSWLALAPLVNSAIGLELTA